MKINCQNDWACDSNMLDINKRRRKGRCKYSDKHSSAGSYFFSIVREPARLFSKFNTISKMVKEIFFCGAFLVGRIENEFLIFFNIGHFWKQSIWTILKIEQCVFPFFSSIIYSKMFQANFWTLIHTFYRFLPTNNEKYKQLKCIYI